MPEQPPTTTDAPVRPAGHALALGGVARLGRLIRKELSEILRDRRTILTLVLMPLLLYPLLSIGFRHYLILSSGVATEEPEASIPLVRLGYINQREQSVFTEALQRAALLTRWRQEQRGRVTPVDAKFHHELLSHDLVTALQKREIDLGVRIHNADQVRLPLLPRRRFQEDRTDQVVECELLYLKNSAHSQEALEHIYRQLSVSAALDLRTRLQPVDRPLGIVVVDVAEKGIEPDRQLLGESLAPIIPLILILMTITGAVYPAIDLTAGERERGTLEVLIAAPVPRLGLLFAKYVSVFTVAVLTAVVNLASMTATLHYSGLGHLLFGSGGVTWLLLLQILALLLLFGGFFSAVLLSITSFARSFKEAQAYLIPLMLVSLAPGLAGLLPGLHLSLPLATVPLLNIVLLGRDLFTGRVEWLPAVVVILSTLTYAAAAIAIAARIFGAETVLYSEHNSWGEVLRRPRHPRSEPAVGTALLCLALTIPGTLLMQGLVRSDVKARPTPASMEFQIVGSTLGSLLLFAGVPWLATWWRRIQPVSAFRLSRPRWLAWLGGLLLGLSLGWLVVLLLAVLERLGFSTLTPALRDQLRAALRHLLEMVPLWLLVTSVVIQAVAEEVFFRGFLFSALQQASGTVTAIVVSTLLFAGMHGLTAEIFALERIIPSLLLGLSLGLICAWTGSLWPGLVLHGVHNAVMMSARYCLTGEQLELVVGNWWWIALLVAAVGAVLVGMSRGKSSVISH